MQNRQSKSPLLAAMLLLIRDPCIEKAVLALVQPHLQVHSQVNLNLVPEQMDLGFCLGEREMVERS